MNIIKRNKHVGNDQIKPFDVNEFEDELVLLAGQQHPRDLDQHHTPLPASSFKAEDLGKITADAVRASHEEAAKAITELGLKAVARVERLNQIKAEAEELAKSCLDLAAKYRAKGDKEAEDIELTARLNNQAREMITEMHRKIDPTE